MQPPWTSRVPLPGSDFESRDQARNALFDRYRRLAPEIVEGVFRRHGALAADVLGDGEIGEHYGAGLSERELRYFIDHEWASSAEDVLWRRTKAGLHLDEGQCARIAEVIGA
jgi:glycerol-3-phosphate dehydrogenase